VLIEVGSTDCNASHRGASIGLSRLRVHRSPRRHQHPHGVDSSMKQPNLAFAGGHLLEHGLEPLSKFTAVFRAGKSGAPIGRASINLAVLQGRGHITVDRCVVGQPLHDRGFCPHPGSPISTGLFLGAAARIWIGAPDFPHRGRFTGSSLPSRAALVEIHAVFSQGFVGGPSGF